MDTQGERYSMNSYVLKKEINKKTMCNLNRRGYVIPLTLIILSLSIAIVSYIFIRSAVYTPYMNMMIKREQAKMLAMGGVNIALSQITHVDQDEKKTDKKNEGQSKKADSQKQLLENILPSLNRAQTFKLKQDKEGADGEIQITICCEAGKIPINDVYDFETQKFVELQDVSAQNVVVPKGSTKPEQKTWQTILKELFKRVESQTGGKKLLEAFEKFLKSRQYRVNDVTELLTIKEFDVFKHSVWYEAPSQQKGKKGEKERPLYLQDLFTITSSKKINPWFFSDSLCGVLELPRAKAGEIKNREKQMQKWMQNFQATSNWKTEWEKQLKPVYGRDFQSLPKGIEMILDSTTQPTYFSVISQGTIDQVTQRVVAYIVIKDKQASIYRMYWL